jgi:molecular chaperone DnaJ
MAEKKDYYDVLSVSKEATEDEIKKAYRKLAIRYHPDKNPDDPEAAERFREATEAYEVLKDDNKRKQYDRFGHTAFDGGAGFGGGGGGFSSSGFGGMDLNEALKAFMGDFGGDSFYGDIFGSSRTTRRTNQGTVNQGKNIQIKLPLSLKEMHDGVSKTIKIKHSISCSSCGGSGSKSGKLENCAQCNGSGRSRRVMQSIFGQMVQETVCPRCSGTGKTVKDPCGACSGTGVIDGEDKVTVTIPAGVSEGNYVTVSGKGDKGINNGVYGDLIVIIHEKDDSVFTRHGLDLVTEMEISFSEAALGCERVIETFSDKVKVKVPAGTQSEKVMKIPGKGMPIINNEKNRGDILIKISVKTPEKLSKEERELFEKLQGLEQKPKSFFRKIMDFGL